MCLFFFFKQKTAYEMRISDWSSDVCSSDLWRGAASDRFLADAVRRVRQRGGRIVHLDLTIICEHPKIGPHREAIRDRVAGICGVPAGRVSEHGRASWRERVCQ